MIFPTGSLSGPVSIWTWKKTQKKRASLRAPSRVNKIGSQIEARRRYETTSLATNGSIRNGRMCRRTAVLPQTSFFPRRFKASRGTEWDDREEGGGGGGAQTEGLLLPGTGLCHLTPATEWAPTPCPLGRKLAPRQRHRNSKGRVYANRRGQRKWVPLRPDENGTCFPHRQPFKQQ